MNTKKKESKAWLWGVLALVVLVPLVFILVKRMEGTPPAMNLDLASPHPGGSGDLDTGG